MRRYPSPSHSTPEVFHRHRGVEPFGDGVRDYGLGALFLEQFESALLFFASASNASGFVFEEAGEFGFGSE